VDPPLKDWIATKPDLVTIEYHAPFPYAGDPFYQANIPEQDNRISYNQITGTPTIRMDGPHQPSPYSPSGYENLYLQRKAIPSLALVELEGDYEPASRTGEVTATVVAESALPGSDWRLRIALTESGIDYAAPNGINIHDHVVRRFVPDTAGTALTFSAPYPDTATVTLPFAVDAGWAEENVSLVALLQEQGSREIEQGAEIAVSDLVIGIAEGAAPEPVALDQLGPVRPNPFNPRARIPFDLARDGHVVLKVYDQAGRLVRLLVDEVRTAGGHTVEWDGRDQFGRAMTSGVYLFRLETGTGSSSGRAVLLR
jgi:hypothetical protein